jgi:hypothetical protein
MISICDPDSAWQVGQMESRDHCCSALAYSAGNLLKEAVSVDTSGLPGKPRAMIGTEEEAMIRNRGGIPWRTPQCHDAAASRLDFVIRSQGSET